MIYITIDAGTTNTRAKVWRNGNVIAHSAAEVGVRDTAITGSKAALQQGVRLAMEQACRTAAIDEADITAIIASGMITSELGLCELPHLTAPAGLDELAAGMVSRILPEVSNQPIWFIPGIKNNTAQITLENCEQMDMMRGEETETIGAMQRLGELKAAIYVLPGSHTKFVQVDGNAKIRGCLTTLGGELLGVITHHTILADALQHSFANEIVESMLLKGAHYAKQAGLGRTCFTLRILDRFAQYGLADKSSFLLGAILATDLIALKSSKAIAALSDSPIVILGKNPLKEAFAILIRNDEYFQGGIRMMPEEVAADLAGCGAIAIAQKRGLIK